MQEEKICNGLHHDALGRRSGHAVQYTSSDQAAVRFGECFPDTGANGQGGEDDTGKSSAEDVGAGYNDEVGVTQRNHRDSGKQAELLYIEMEFGAE